MHVTNMNRRGSCFCSLTLILAASLGGEAARLDPGRADSFPLDWPPQPVKMDDLVVPKAYLLEKHFVTTSDGYILSLYRIPFGRAGRGGPPRAPLILQHGIFDTSAAWVLNDPDQSLAFLAAEAGWDVWLPNSRGNDFSLEHTTLDISQREYWNFTFGTMAEEDLPAIMEYVLEKTRHPKVAYVGHSQGATQLVAASSRHPELAEKVSLAVLLAPVLSMQRVDSLLWNFLAKLNVDRLLALSGLAFRIGQSNLLSRTVIQLACPSGGGLEPILCSSILTLACGFNENQLNMTRFKDYVKYLPGGTSIYNAQHWLQLLRGARRLGRPVFQSYSWGDDCPRRPPFFWWEPGTCNAWAYRDGVVPSYDLSKVNIPLVVYAGEGDKLGVAQDTADALAAMPSQTVLNFTTVHDYEHLDFTWSVVAKYDLYPEILEWLKKGSSSAPDALMHVVAPD
ncbi:LIP2 [Auxenochlorella protothecoides x Auxenochlorella symbiontica]